MKTDIFNFSIRHLTLRDEKEFYCDGAQLWVANLQTRPDAQTVFQENQRL